MADDPELQRIRQARLQQLAAQAGRSSGSPSIGSAGGDDEEQRKAESEARKSILNQILTPEAADRLGRIGLVNADRARDVENRLIMMARTGQLPARATEDDLVKMLGAMRELERERENQGVGKVIFSRRKGGWDDEDDF
ncbi:PDCD5-related protein [Kalaharituber pfeilii]|nr:PDCD5-related protein [Kalaharituber pfeilii]